MGTTYLTRRQCQSNLSLRLRSLRSGVSLSEALGKPLVGSHEDPLDGTLESLASLGLFHHSPPLDQHINGHAMKRVTPGTTDACAKTCVIRFSAAPRTYRFLGLER